MCVLGASRHLTIERDGCYGDGGACFTRNDGLSGRMREISQHGQSERYVHRVVGINGRLDSIQAAILLAKLPHLAWELEARAAVAERYDDGLRGIVRLPRTAAGNTHVYAQYTIEVDNRDRFRKVLEAFGIQTAIHYPTPLHLQPAYSNGLGLGAFPVSERAAGRVVSLPLHPYLQESDQDRVIAAVKKAALDC